MAESSSDSPSSESTLYREFLAEREEVLRHKWLMSEREGRDVGFETALTDWCLHFRGEWKKNYLKSLSPRS